MVKQSNDNLKTLYEYEPCTDEAVLSEFKYILSIKPELYKYMEIASNTVKFKHYTGFIRTRKYRIQILPKFLKIKADENDNESDNESDNKNNLIRILMYVFFPTGTTIPKIEINNDKKDLDLQDLIIRLYAISFKEQILQGAYRKYIKRSREGTYLTGKLNINMQINKIDQSKFYVDDFRFSINNDLNRFFAYANKYFKHQTKDKTNINILSWIGSILQEEDLSPWNKCQINFNRMNERFKIPYVYASMILNNMITIPDKKRDTIAIIFDMNKIFEQFFAKFIKRNKSNIFKNDSIGIQIQPKSKNFIYNIKNNAIRFTKPDLILLNKNYKCVFDTKYKKLDVPKIDNNKKNMDKVHLIGQNDLYQMYAYSQIYNSNDTVLVFPGFDNMLSEPYKFKMNCNKKLWVYMLKFNLNSNNWEKELVKDFAQYFEKIGLLD